MHSYTQSEGASTWPLRGLSKGFIGSAPGVTDQLGEVNILTQLHLHNYQLYPICTISPRTDLSPNYNIITTASCDLSLNFNIM